MRFFTSFLAVIAISLAAKAVVPVAKSSHQQVIVAKESSQVQAEYIANPIVERGVTKSVKASSRVFTSSRAGGEVSYSDPTPFSTGLSTELRSYTGIMRGGAYCPVIWGNTSTATGECEWSFNDELYSSKNLELNLPYDLYDYPTLTVGEESYTRTFVGNDGSLYPYNYMAGGSNAHLFGEDAPNYGIQTLTDPCESNYSYGDVFAYPSETWTGFYDGYSDDCQVTGFCNIFPAPNSPYYTTKAWTWMYWEATKSFPLSINIYILEEDGSLGERIAFGETLVSPDSDDVVEFDLVSLDEEGLETEEPITISTAVAVIIEGFVGSDGLNKLYMLWPKAHKMTLDEWQNDELPYENHAFLQLSGTWNDDGEEFVQYRPQCAAYFVDQTRQDLWQTTDFAVYLDATFAWGVPTNGEYTIEIPKEGGEVEVEITSYWLPIAYWMKFPEDADDSWLLDVSGYDTEDNIYFVFDTEALPEGVEGRSLPITFDAPGIKPFTLTLQQGSLAISDINSDVNVQSVEYYDVMGRKLNEAPQNGLFIEKAVMTDGTVKATKISR